MLVKGGLNNRWRGRRERCRGSIKKGGVVKEVDGSGEAQYQATAKRDW